MSRTITLSILAAACTFVATSASAADPAPAAKSKSTTAAKAEVKPSANDTGYAYEFGDDALNGLNNGPTGATIRIRQRTVRRTLIRPRLHFIPEMLKSVENI